MKEKINTAPRNPGVYLMKDARNKIIYIGKANDLKSRVGSYFSGKDTRPMAPFLLLRVADIEFITTSTEKEALILENNLIKKHHPRYNIVLRDDKTYYHLSLDPAEGFPRLRLVRKRGNDKVLYFGPYPSGLAARETLRFVQRIFPLRTCLNRDFELRKRPCLEFQIGRCLAPCKGMIGREDYEKLVTGAVSFLKGKRRELISGLKEQMGKAAESLDYEEAARLRDRIAALEHVLEKQYVDLPEGEDKDVLGVFANEDVYSFCLLYVRAGKITGSKSFIPVRNKASVSEVVSMMLAQYYDADIFIPDEILLPCILSDDDVIAEWLSDRKMKKVTLSAPQRGSRKALLDLACANAREVFNSAVEKEQSLEAALFLLQDKLQLSRLPKRIECYDISNIGGSSAVGSQVVFINGEPDKTQYRRFRIQTLKEPDDYGMMREMLTRRFSNDRNPPDLVVVDGGKGQLNVALSVLRDLGIKADVVGLAKEESSYFAARNKLKGKKGKTEDRVYLPRRKDALYLSSAPKALAVLQNIRDEAHRFAVSYHHKVKQQEDFSSELDKIPDIGTERRKKLLVHFGSLARVKKASLEDLQNVPGIGKELAEKIYAGLRDRE